MRRLVVVVACALALAGCGGDPKADPSPAPSSPTTSASPTPTPPVMPDAAKANTKAGAVAFVKYYIELINHAQATGDVDALAAVEDPGCKSCAAARSGVKHLYESGGSISGGSWEVEKISAIKNDAIEGWVVDVKVHYEKQVVSYGTGRPPKANEAGEMVASFQVQPADAWKVLEWTRGS